MERRETEELSERGAEYLEAEPDISEYSESDDEAAAAEELAKRSEEQAANIERNTLRFGMIKAALASLGLYAGYYFFPQMFFMLFSSDTLQNNGTLKLLASSMGFFVYFAVLMRYYVKRSQKTGETLGDILRLRPREVGAKNVGICMLLGVSLNLAGSALLAIIPFPEEWISSYSGGTTSLLYTDSIAFSLIYITLIAPVCEELMFRGFMYHRMRTAFSVRVSAIAVTAAFALPHIDPIWIAAAVLNGFVFTIVRERFDNLCHSIILHVFYNLVSVPMLLLTGTQAYTILFDNIIAELIYLVFGGIAIYLCIKRLLKKDMPAEEPTYNIYSSAEEDRR